MHLQINAYIFRFYGSLDLYSMFDLWLRLGVQTGTLTEGDLDLAGVCEARDQQFQVIFIPISADKIGKY